MATRTGIEWTETTWNPTTGCDRISPGCDNCYALTLARRLKAMGLAKYQNDGDPRTSGPGVDAGDSFSCPGLAGTRAAGEDQVLPRRPGDHRAGLSAGLFRAQHGDRSGELLADRLQTRKVGQAAHVAILV